VICPACRGLDERKHSDRQVALAHADLALYEAKNTGRNRVRLFAADHYQQAARRASVLSRVDDALNHVRLSDRTTGRHELLLRLRDGRVPDLVPAQFLPTAERTDVIGRLDRWGID
jgi:predicted signal transduction protein with EAL and GGDEF domain